MGRALNAKGWDEYRNVIASELTSADWVIVVRAVEAIGHLQLSRDDAVRSARAEMAADPDKATLLAAAETLGLDAVELPAIPDSRVAQLEIMLRDIQAGRDALAALMASIVRGGTVTPGRVHRR